MSSQGIREVYAKEVDGLEEKNPQETLHSKSASIEEEVDKQQHERNCMLDESQVEKPRRELISVDC